MKAEAGKVTFIREVVALPRHVSQRFAVLWDGLSNHAQERENACTSHGLRFTVTPCSHRSISYGQQRIVQNLMHRRILEGIKKKLCAALEN